MLQRSKDLIRIDHHKSKRIHDWLRQHAVPHDPQGKVKTTQNGKDILTNYFGTYTVPQDIKQAIKEVGQRQGQAVREERRVRREQEEEKKEEPVRRPIKEMAQEYYRIVEERGLPQGKAFVREMEQAGHTKEDIKRALATERKRRQREEDKRLNIIRHHR